MKEYAPVSYPKKHNLNHYCISDSLPDSSNIQLDYSKQLFKMKQKIAQCSLQEESPFSSIQTQKVEKVNKKKKSKKNQSFSVFQNNLKKLGLKGLIQNQKVNSIVKNFITKANRNISASKPVQYYPYAPISGTSFFSKNGFQIPNWFQLSFSFLSILQIFALCFVYTLSLVFDALVNSEFIQALQTFSICFYTIQIIINFFSIKTIDGRKITILRQIFENYFKWKFFIDLLCLIILIVDINTQFVITKFLRLCDVLKIKQCLQKMQKIQNFFINNFYKQQYWSLTKVILVNFGFAHILAILLLAMAVLQQENNWMRKINIQETPWYEKYSWAYYWGTTIMLTVGFGDLSAANYKQALCLTMIQTISCILLAYNINCVGNLINNIRTQDYQKNKNFKIMRKLAENNDIEHELEWKVCNYMNQSDKMKKQFCFEQQKQFIAKLPDEFKSQFLKQSNIKIFQNIKFFRNFTQKSLLTLAEHIQVKITHPEQVIFKTEDTQQLLILKQGKVGYCTKLAGSKYFGTVIDMIQVKKKQMPFLLYLGFLNQNVRNMKFKIKSLKYSIIYFLEVHQAKKYIKSSAFDFQGLCQMRDKSKHIVDEFQILECKNCKTKHSQMNCPKLHYIPIYQMIVYKYLQQLKLSKNQRVKINRVRSLKQLSSNSPFRLRHFFKKIQEQVYKSKKMEYKNQKITRKTYFCNSSGPSDAQLISKILPSIKINFAEQQKSQSKILDRIIKILSNKDTSENTQFFWDLQCDYAHNFKYYFPKFNPIQLIHQVVFQPQSDTLNKSPKQILQRFMRFVLQVVLPNSNQMQMQIQSENLELKKSDFNGSL